MNNKKIKKISLFALIVMFIILTMLITIVISSNDNTEPDSNIKTTNEQQISVDKNYLYDDLQNIFLETTPETTTDDFLKIIKNYNVISKSKEYNTMDGCKDIVYKVAYEDEVAWFSHADTGDYIQVTFNENKELKRIEYFNTNAWFYDRNDVYSAILENENDSIIGGTGYYGEYFKTVTETDYKKFSSGKLLVNYIINQSEKNLQENNTG